MTSKSTIQRVVCYFADEPEDYYFSLDKESEKVDFIHAYADWYLGVSLKDEEVNQIMSYFDYMSQKIRFCR